LRNWFGWGALWRGRESRWRTGASGPTSGNQASLPCGYPDDAAASAVNMRRCQQMADIVLVLVVLAFFGLCVLYVRGCDRLIRSDGIDEPGQ
jgi:hypothetical protein